jgi:GntR family transcriptional regulator, arabinose operon transcriptional repressor
MSGQQKVKEGIYQDIISGGFKPGDRIPSIRTLGKLYSVAHLTSWKACADLQREGVLIVKPQKGCFVTDRAQEIVQHLIFQRKRHVILLTFSQSDALDDFYNCIHNIFLRELSLPTWAKKINLQSIFSINTLSSLIDEEKSIDCIIDIGIGVPAKLMEKINSRKIKFLRLETDSKECPAAVLWDQEDGGYQLTKYLLELGHQEIAWIGGHTRRLVGAERAYREYGLDFQQMKIAGKILSPRLVNDEIKRLYSLNQLPTAMIFFYDKMVAEATKTIKTLGFSIPNDISIASFGDTSYAQYIDPELTSVGFDHQLFLEESIKRLDYLLLDQQDKIKRRVIPSRLSIRSSCGPARTHYPLWAKNCRYL